MPKTIEISHRTVIFTVLFLGAVWLLIQISSIILGLFVSVLLMTALNPLVDRLNRFGLPRALGILLVYLVLIAAIVAGLSAVIPPLIDQTARLAERLPTILDQTVDWLKTLGVTNIDEETLSSQVSQLGTIPANILLFLVAFLSNILNVFTILVITFYLLLERANLEKYLLVVFGEGQEPEAKRFIDQLESRLGGWVRGELILMTIIGVVTYIGLSALGIPYALPLAILAGILEILPNIGPLLSSVPAIIVALTMSPVMAVATAALYFIIQQLENILIAPKVMQKAAGVNPLVTIVSLAVGFKLAGVVGAILAVPVVIVLHVVATEIFGFREAEYLEKSYTKKSS